MYISKIRRIQEQRRKREMIKFALLMGITIGATAVALVKIPKE